MYTVTTLASNTVLSYVHSRLGKRIALCIATAIAVYALRFADYKFVNELYGCMKHSLAPVMSYSFQDFVIANTLITK